MRIIFIWNQKVMCVTVALKRSDIKFVTESTLIVFTEERLNVTCVFNFLQ